MEKWYIRNGKVRHKTKKNGKRIHKTEKSGKIIDETEKWKNDTYNRKWKNYTYNRKMEKNNIPKTKRMEKMIHKTVKKLENESQNRKKRQYDT